MLDYETQQSVVLDICRYFALIFHYFIYEFLVVDEINQLNRDNCRRKTLMIGTGVEIDSEMIGDFPNGLFNFASILLLFCVDYAALNFASSVIILNERERSPSQPISGR